MHSRYFMILAALLTMLLRTIIFALSIVGGGTIDSVPSSSIVIPAGNDNALPSCPSSPEEYIDTEYCKDFLQQLGDGEIVFHAIFDFIRPSSLPLMSQQVSLLVYF